MAMAMAEDEAVAVEGTVETTTTTTEGKRKLEEIYAETGNENGGNTTDAVVVVEEEEETEVGKETQQPEAEKEEDVAVEKDLEDDGGAPAQEFPEAKRPRLEEVANEEEENHDVEEKTDAENHVESVPGEDDNREEGDVNQEQIAQEEDMQDAEHTNDDVPPTSTHAQEDQPESEVETSRRIEVPNNRVGVLIGKAGDTIRFLQYNSGAKIQITKDLDSDPNATSRSVELVGTESSITKAEQLIKDVIAEADAGGSPALVARGFGTIQSGGDQILMPIPNDKVGLVIGKGGETIKNLQTRSGARIQLIPQNQPGSDISSERMIRVTGNKKQIESAKEMIKEVMSQLPGRSASTGLSAQPYRPHGPSSGQLGARGTPFQQMVFDHSQRGPYPAQGHYPPNSGGYPPQNAPRGSFNAGWEQRPPAHAPTQPGGHDYYGQRGHNTEGLPPSSAHPSATQTAYNYGQMQGGSAYGQQPMYPQSTTPQQGYGHGYYGQGPEKTLSTQAAYGGQAQSQPGYGQQGMVQSGYAQQDYIKPAASYDQMQSQGLAVQSYGPPRSSQYGEVVQQAPPSTQPYGSSGSVPQPYPYGASGASQQSYPYGQQASGGIDGYGQQQPASSTIGGYAQGGQAGGYGQYPSQPGYGYQGSADPAYSGMQSAAAAPTYGGGLNLQQGYGQVQPTQTTYDQSAPASGYGDNYQAGYIRSISPQTGYAPPPYDSSQLYGRH